MTVTSSDPGGRQPRQRPRRRGAILAVLALGFAGLLALQSGKLMPPLLGMISGLGVPDQIKLCDRSYEGGDGRHWTYAEVRDLVGVEPVVVDPWDHASCVPGACANVATNDPCHTLIYARVGPNELVAYELQGGP